MFDIRSDKVSMLGLQHADCWQWRSSQFGNSLKQDGTIPPCPRFFVGNGTDRLEVRMNGIIYLIGLIVVIMAILSFLGLR
jgi:hypothetical protein